MLDYLTILSLTLCRFTVSEVASQLHQTLGNHQVQLDACVSKRQLAPKLQQMNLSLSSEITRVLSLCAKQTEVNKIENTQKELNARVTSVERGLMNKVNTSEISYIDSLVSRLEMYTQFQDSTAKSLARIDQELTKIEENCLEFDRNIQSLDAESKQIQERADGFASKTDLQCMATELLELSQVVNQCASHDALVTVSPAFCCCCYRILEWFLLCFELAVHFLVFYSFCLMTCVRRTYCMYINYS